MKISEEATGDHFVLKSDTGGLRTPGARSSASPLGSW